LWPHSARRSLKAGDQDRGQVVDIRAFAGISAAKPGAADSFGSARGSTDKAAKLLTTFNGFLLSWAIPAVSCPRDAVFSAFSAWIRLAWTARRSSRFQPLPSCLTGLARAVTPSSSPRTRARGAGQSAAAVLWVWPRVAPPNSLQDLLIRWQPGAESPTARAVTDDPGERAFTNVGEIAGRVREGREGPFQAGSSRPVRARTGTCRRSH